MLWEEHGAVCSMWGLRRGPKVPHIAGPHDVVLSRDVADEATNGVKWDVGFRTR